MAESIHAVISNRQQKSPHNFQNVPQQQQSENKLNISNNNDHYISNGNDHAHKSHDSSNNNIRQQNITNRLDMEDEDDDIHIIVRSITTPSSSSIKNNILPLQQSSSGAYVNVPSSHVSNFSSESSSLNNSQNQSITPKNQKKTTNQTSLLDQVFDAHFQTNSSIQSGQQQQNLNKEQQQNSSEWIINHNLLQDRNRLQRKLRYHFMSPLDKWQIKGRFPWKLLFQIIKIIFVTTQVVLFGYNSGSIRAVDNSMLSTLHNLFLLQWNSLGDIESGPPNIEPYAVYTKEDIYQHIDYAIKNYANVTNLGFGSFGYQLNKQDIGEQLQSDQTIKIMKNLEMSFIYVCFQRYTNATLNPSYREYFIDPRIKETCLTISNLYPPGSPKWLNFSFYEYLLKNNPDEMDFDSLIHLSLKLPLRVMLLNTIAVYNTPQCFDLDMIIHFNNKPHSGQISISLTLKESLINCIGNLKAYNYEAHVHNTVIIINCIVLFLSTTSLILCIRTLLKAQLLRKETNRFFMMAYKRHLEMKSSCHFIDGWILMILLNDLLLLIGTIINLIRRFNMNGPHKINLFHPFQLDNLCSAFLGIGLLLVWFGILRYLAFFDQYNILLLTIKHSLSRVLRFTLCVLVLYGGFCFSGWIILGPYHFKFYTLARTSECLFALMNGDDVFATFSYLESSSSSFVWWFSRIYLYSYILLFIYIVLSLFIAILMDSYEIIKEYYSNNNRKRKIRIDFSWSNDQLSRFLLAKLNNDDDDLDTISRCRINLINDEQQRQDNCCPCYNNHSFLSWFSHCFRNIWTRIQCSHTHQNHYSDSILHDNENEALDQAEVIN